ncbi:hypothetical protein HCY65_02010 [Acinetobacter radioresistens]|uniref:hypothetical protein n=1 Tax=Acinetobacter radioresistens TaxID=40216 RepID=UPI002005B8BF|nr:hypothetical protein [Acinetobacter radioresistens]MCK4109857.1 hypothetical protein [Acinetobacter radioresistens]
MKRLTPLLGMDNVSDDESMSSFGKTPFVKLRDAVNVNITSAGRMELRDTGTVVTETPYKNLWCSPLHGDTFGTLNGELVKIDTSNWSHVALNIELKGSVNYLVVNNFIIISDALALYKYDGAGVIKLTIGTPPPPMARLSTGALLDGTYTVAIAWSKDGRESGLSSSLSLNVEGGIELILPYNYSEDADQVVIYMTERNGSELLKVGAVTVNTATFNISSDKDLTRAAQFQNLSPMRTGKFLKLWRGRLLTADKNMLYFSQALNFHLCDERYDYIALPQRVTFVEPVESGVWVGQSNSVVFLSGNDVRDLRLVQTGAKAPVPGTALRVNSDLLGEAAAGLESVLWLAENGYCVGTPSGNLVEAHANTLKGITAKGGQSVRFDDRIVTVLH